MLTEIQIRIIKENEKLLIQKVIEKYWLCKHYSYMTIDNYKNYYYNSAYVYLNFGKNNKNNRQDCGISLDVFLSINEILINNIIRKEKLQKLEAIK